MLTESEVSAAVGSSAYGPDGEKIGTVEHFYADDRTGAPTWVAVTTGLFGTRHSIVPAVDASFVDGGLRVPVGREAVRAAPQLPGEHLDPGDEADLRRHYGLDTALPATPDTAPQTAPGIPAAVAPPLEPDTAERPAVAPAPPPSPARPQDGTENGPGNGTGDGSMIRSEEQLRIRTERVPARRVRLVKYVVTENVQITVPVRREEFRLEEVPLDGPDPGPGESLPGSPGDAPAGPGGAPTVSIPSLADGGFPAEIVLHAERPVVSVQVVPVERIRLSTELVAGTEQVTSQVQREQIVVEEGPRPPRPSPARDEPLGGAAAGRP